MKNKKRVRVGISSAVVLGTCAALALPGGISTLLLGFGLVSAAGVALAGRVTTRTAGWLVLTSAATALSLAALAWAGRPVIGLLAILAGGATATWPRRSSRWSSTAASPSVRPLPACSSPAQARAFCRDRRRPRLLLRRWGSGG